MDGLIYKKILDELFAYCDLRRSLAMAKANEASTNHDATNVQIWLNRLRGYDDILNRMRMLYKKYGGDVPNVQTD